MSHPARALLAALSFVVVAGCQDPVKEPVVEPGKQAGREPGRAAAAVPNEFARYEAVGDGGHFDTAIVRYEKNGVTVDLIGAVHIADQAHYAQLNERFRQYDALLYELVADEGTRPDPNRRTSGLISALQQAMKRGLELEFQLDGVDYSPANFVHADMSPEEMQGQLKERRETLFGVMMRSVRKHMEEQRELAIERGETPEPVDLVKAFRNGEGRHQMRVMFASHLSQMEAMVAGDGEEGGSVLLEGRNDKCLKVLERELAAGRKKLGIYYGAAHMRHMEKRLVDDFGFRPVQHEWLVAWDCTRRPDKPVKNEQTQKQGEAPAGTGK